ncbi:hypothetical protein N7466_003194 [Penicillium verhagenii]|uniref:uncharacterized protein n=1 Tax=Penicillium verhagenii TaxID=1562060 RepID=UPI0025453431|nr:uncharacterized protein N7466_003194 [Penicillium verhagenii]KAJ5936744.1 hypothetical protein N7466_003194 [Penicillium verhagenii]
MSMIIKSCTPIPKTHRILMLHGHGQSGDFFFSKTQFFQETMDRVVREALEDDPALRKIDVVEFYYPSGLLPADPDTPLGEGNDSMRAWGYGDYTSGRIIGLEKTIQYLSDLLQTRGPFTGIIGFSTGACVTAILASLLEKKRPVCNLPFNTTHPPLKFAVCFSGFKLDHPYYAPLYKPMIETPILHVIGTLDTMIDPLLSRRLSKYCLNASTHYFTGTHYVPRSQRFLESLNDFVWDALSQNKDQADECWEDYNDDFMFNA